MWDSPDLEMPDALLPFAGRLFSRFPEVLLALGQQSLIKDFELPPSGNSCTVIEETGDYKLVQVLLGRRGCRSSLGPSFARRRGNAVTAQCGSSAQRSRAAEAVAANTACVSKKAHPSKSKGVGKVYHQQHSSAISISSTSAVSYSSGPRSQNGTNNWKMQPGCHVEQIEEMYPVGFGLSHEASSGTQDSPGSASRQRPSLGTVFRASDPSQIQQAQMHQARQRSRTDNINQEPIKQEAYEKQREKSSKSPDLVAAEVSISLPPRGPARSQPEHEPTPTVAGQMAALELKAAIDETVEKDRTSTFEVSEASAEISPQLVSAPVQTSEISSAQLTPPRKSAAGLGTGDSSQSMYFQEAKSAKTDPGPKKTTQESGSSDLEDFGEESQEGSKKGRNKKEDSPRRNSAPVVSAPRAPRTAGDKRSRDSKGRMPEPESPRSPGSFKPWGTWGSADLPYDSRKSSAGKAPVVEKNSLRSTVECMSTRTTMDAFNDA